jgi:hypothetical protein
MSQVSPTVTIDYIGTVASSGAQTMMPSATTVYNLRGTNFIATVSKSVVIIVNPQPINISFDVTPAIITFGGYSTLLWHVTGASAVAIDQGIGQVPSTGNKLGGQSHFNH